MAGTRLEAEGLIRPSWVALADGLRPETHYRRHRIRWPEGADREPGQWAHGWQFYGSHARNTHQRATVVLPALAPAARALLRSQSGAHAGAWLHATPCEPGLALDPARMQIALRRRLRLPLPLRPALCGSDEGPGCGGRVDPFGDHEAACSNSGRLQKRAKPVERAWIRVAREGVGANGQVVGQAWLAHTTAPGVAAGDRRRLDLVVYGASGREDALCCDAGTHDSRTVG